MKHRYSALLLAGLTVISLGLSSAQAQTPNQNIDQTKVVGDFKVELQVLPPEPFYTQDDVKSQGVTSGMVIEGGERPVKMDDPSAPDHHLIVHVFDKATGKVVTDANVSLGFEPSDMNGKVTGQMTYVPTVVMQAIGKGPDSTHYGNNVSLKVGHYEVVCMVNGQTVLFQIKI